MTKEKNTENKEKAQQSAPEIDTQTASEQEEKAEKEQPTEETPVENDEETTQEVTSEETIKKLEEELAEQKNRYLYLQAEYQNFRKRTAKEKADLLLNGAQSSVNAVLPVMDDMERAMANAQKTDDPKVLKEGMTLICQKFEKALEGLGVKRMITDGVDFDTDLHEAVAMVPGVPDEQKGKVIDCIQSGYMLNDKVIRHAKVAVGQ